VKNIGEISGRERGSGEDTSKLDKEFPFVVVLALR